MSTENGTATANQQQATGTPGKIVSAGPVVAGAPPFQKAPEVVDTNQNSQAAGQNQNTQDPPAGADAGQQGAPDNQGAGLPDLSNEQLEQILKSRGIELSNGLDGLKNNQSSQQQAPAELTPEEKAQQEAERDIKVLNLFLRNGGTPENYVALKKVAAMDAKEIAEAQIRTELAAEGFDENQIAEIIRERYYQINLDELVQGEEESEEEFQSRKDYLSKKAAYGKKIFETRFSHLKQQAEKDLNDLRTALETEESLSQVESQIASTVDAVAQKLQRKLTFELGKINDQETSPIQFDVSEDHVAAVVDILKDPAKRNQLLFTPENQLNFQSIAEVLLRNQILEDALKASYIDGGSAQVAIFEKVFPGRTAQQVGIGGNNASGSQGRKGHLVSAGAPTPASFPSKK